MIRALVILLAVNELACVAPLERDSVTATASCCTHVYEPSYYASGALGVAAVGQCPSAPPAKQCTPYVPALPGDGADFVCEVQADGGSFTPNPDGGIPVSFCF